MTYIKILPIINTKYERMKDFRYINFLSEKCTNTIVIIINRHNMYLICSLYYFVMVALSYSRRARLGCQYWILYTFSLFLALLTIVYRWCFMMKFRFYKYITYRVVHLITYKAFVISKTNKFWKHFVFALF